MNMKATVAVAQEIRADVPLAHDPVAFAAYLDAQEKKSLLRFLTCGSVDDGKSTLIGRLLYDSKLVFEDHLFTLAKDSRRHGTTGEEVDLALLLDGLEAEREQGITIDVAYRFFTTEKRKFIVADTPGHEQYTRNMATGASTSDLAVLLVDARYGIVTQTRRHAFIVSLLGIRHVVLAVNKIDLVGFDAAVYDRIRAEFETLTAGFGFETRAAIPLSARYGDNVTGRSERMPWYRGPTLIEHLETVEVAERLGDKPFRMAVQWVNRPNLDFRGFSGTIASGRVAPGDRVVVAKSGKVSTVARIVTYDGDLPEAGAGEAVTLTLADEIDISRGDVLAAVDARPEVADQFAARLVWMSEEPLYPGRSYLLKCGSKTVTANVTELKHKIDVNTLAHQPAKDLQLNEVAVVNVALSEPIAFDPYAENRETGAFILIDRLSNATVGAGMIDFALRRATNVHWQSIDVDKQSRANLKNQQPAVVWFTGLSGSGKSTIANVVEKKLHALGMHTYLLDGDNVRHGLNRDLGFTEADRVENIRRVGEVAKLFVDAGLIVLVSFISPFRAERQMARDLVGEGEFVEVFVDTPLEECERRDVKGLYAKARSGALKNFTGIDSPYEAPENPEIHIRTLDVDLEAAADRVVRRLVGDTPDWQI
jgi:bifunctional enzyme CysN/CysC